MTVLITQIGFVAAAVTTPGWNQHYHQYTEVVEMLEREPIPAVAAEAKWTKVFSFPSLNHSAYRCFPFPYTKKLMDLMREQRFS